MAGIRFCEARFAMGSKRSGLRLPQEVPDPGESEGESVSSLADSPRSRISVPGGPDATSTFSRAIGVTRDGAGQVPCAADGAARESEPHQRGEHCLPMCTASTSARPPPVRSRHPRSQPLALQIHQPTSAGPLNPNDGCCRSGRRHGSTPNAGPRPCRLSPHDSANELEHPHHSDVTAVDHCTPASRHSPSATSPPSLLHFFRCTS